MNVFDTTELEDTVVEIIRKIGFSKTIYTARPKAVPTQHLDYVVVNVSGSVVDHTTYGTCTVKIDLFAKDANHIKNGKKLSYMYKSLMENFPASSGKYEFTTEPVLLGDVADDFGYHARLINWKTIIKVQ